MNQEGAARPHDRRRRYQQMSSVSIKIDFQITLLNSELDRVRHSAQHAFLAWKGRSESRTQEIEHQIGKKASN